MNHQEYLEETNTSQFHTENSKAFINALKNVLISRFLVFMDDHIPVYVGLPLLHLVCRPCKFGCFRTVFPHPKPNVPVSYCQLSKSSPGPLFTSTAERTKSLFETGLD